MRRRHLLAMLVGARVALRIATAGSTEPARIGFVSGGDKRGAAGFVAALRDGLAAEGYREPDTLSLDLLYADYSLERVPALVAAARTPTRRADRDARGGDPDHRKRQADGSRRL